MTVEAERYERVYTVTSYWDCPRSGIADCDGQPHVYESVFEEEADDYGDFFLRPVDETTLALALEAWALWVKWRKGEGPPAEQHPRYQELQTRLVPHLAIDQATARRAKATFRRLGPTHLPSALVPFEVRWSVLT
jgi:hypothetical protein